MLGMPVAAGTSDNRFLADFVLPHKVLVFIHRCVLFLPACYLALSERREMHDAIFDEYIARPRACY